MPVSGNHNTHLECSLTHLSVQTYNCFSITDMKHITQDVHTSKTFLKGYFGTSGLDWKVAKRGGRTCLFSVQLLSCGVIEETNVCPFINEEKRAGYINTQVYSEHNKINDRFF